MKLILKNTKCSLIIAGNKPSILPYAFPVYKIEIGITILCCLIA